MSTAIPALACISSGTIMHLIITTTVITTHNPFVLYALSSEGIQIDDSKKFVLPSAGCVKGLDGQR
jgi:hypothetical protein